MKILVIGSGGREHAIGIKLAQSPKKPELHFAPGNPGMTQLGTCHELSVSDQDGLVALAKQERIDLTIVGPEQPLVDGLVDRFQKEGLKVFGPSQAASALEGSKAFSKELMEQAKIPTARHRTFSDRDEALAYLEAEGAPIVVKTSGLAAGKGAIVCMTAEEAKAAVESMLGPDARFGEAGSQVVIEEFMEGEEASLFVLTDGLQYHVLPSAQDHKRLCDYDQGPNTGGMGAYSPAPVLDKGMLERAEREIVEPTLQAMRDRDTPYVGVLFVGLMLTQDGPKVVEYNCRLGDPEAQVVLPLMQEDLLELIEDALEGRLDPGRSRTSGQSAAVVVMASEGYPGSYPKGRLISGLEAAGAIEGVSVLHAGTSLGPDGGIVSSGGRVLGVVGAGHDLKQALDRAYTGVRAISFQGAQYRTDIGQKGLARLQAG